jgi:5-methylcytosine-specific restriction enzyme A
MSALPATIPRRFLLAAMDDLDAATPHAFGASRGYDVLYHGRRYLPKAVVALAITHMDGHTIGPRDFRGGVGSPCFRILASAGFTIVAKGDVDPYGADLGNDLTEGGRVRVEVNRYERDPTARRRCIAFHGRRCGACDVDFGERYGPLGDGFIHVHHLRPLSSRARAEPVDPVHDLRPVCPNCHAMLHRRIPPLTIEELRGVLSLAVNESEPGYARGSSPRNDASEARVSDGPPVENRPRHSRIGTPRR